MTELLKQNIAAHFSRLGSEWMDYKFTPEGYVASDDKVIAYGTYTGTYKLTGKSFTARVAHVNWKIIKLSVLNSL